MEKNVKIWYRKCPKCDEEISYSTNGNKVRAEKRNTNCLSCVMTGMIFSDEHKKNIRESKKGKNNPMYEKSVYDVWLENFGKEEADKRQIKSNRKNRLSQLKNIENRCGQIMPNYNSVGCGIINDYNKKHGFNFQHAENGDEKCIDGYFPDGVDEKRKTIIEIDESKHFNSDGSYKKKDIERQNYLEKIGYKFIRIKI